MQIKSENGFAVIEAVAGIVIATIVYWAIATQQSVVAASIVTTEKKALATLYASELLEFFASYKTSELQSLAGGSSSFSGRPLCAHQNILRRDTGAVLNPDAIADLPPSTLDGPTSSTKANRFYQIQVVDLSEDPLQIDNGLACANLVSAYALAPTQRFLVTVGVTWVPNTSNASHVERVVLSTILGAL